MTKLDSDLLKRFSLEVERARSLKGLNQNELGLHESFVSDIEKGKRNISAKTVGKLIDKLELDKAWVESFLKGSVIGDEERANQLLLMAKMMKSQKVHPKPCLSRVRNDADLAANLIVKRLKLEARPEGLFNAVVDETNTLGKKGVGQSSRFFDKVKLNLAIDNVGRTKGPNKGWAINNISIILSSLAFQEQGVARLEKAKAYAQQAANLGKKFDDIQIRALALGKYADCLRLILQRQGGEIERSDQPV